MIVPAKEMPEAPVVVIVVVPLFERVVLMPLPTETEAAEMFSARARLAPVAMERGPIGVVPPMIPERVIAPPVPAPPAFSVRL